MYLLLSGGYRTGNVWCKLETQLSFHLRYDWFCMCINCLCSYKQYSKCNRCWRSSGNPFHAAAIHVNLCYLYVNCRSSSIGKKKLQPKEVKSVEEVKSAEVTELKAFATGDVIALKEVNDGVFSAGTMGEGFAIIPENETVYAPADATVSLLMQESRHACGLKLANGAEILLHIGIDTVAMKGDGFEYLVKEGQKVSAGTPLIKFDKKKISEAGYVDTIICVITEPGNMENIIFVTGIHAIEKETTVAKTE